MSKCYKVKNLFGSYIYNTITPEERAEVEEHVKTCQKCAEDLRTQQEALAMIRMPQSIDESALQLDEGRFMWNVYRRIALESMKRTSRQVTLRKFVFQPAIATVAIVFVMALVVTRFDNPESPDYTFTPVASNTTTALPEIAELSAEIRESKQAGIERAFVEEESPKPMDRIVAKGSATAKKKAESVIQTRPDFLLTQVRLSNSREWLMNADVINYSLGEPQRALSKYQMIVEHYPDTDAAREAQKRIKTILNSEFESQIREVTVDTESSPGI